MKSNSGVITNNMVSAHFFMHECFRLFYFFEALGERRLKKALANPNKDELIAIDIVPAYVFANFYRDVTLIHSVEKTKQMALIPIGTQVKWSDPEDQRYAGLVGEIVCKTTGYGDSPDTVAVRWIKEADARTWLAGSYFDPADLWYVSDHDQNLLTILTDREAAAVADVFDAEMNRATHYDLTMFLEINDSPW